MSEKKYVINMTFEFRWESTYELFEYLKKMVDAMEELNSDMSRLVISEIDE